ncbi:MAG: hypothetical protein R2752_01390 [Vicinamibacterales bacterium]
MRARLVPVLLCGLLGLATVARAQVVIDRDLVTVHGQVITQSDVWQAIDLQLLPGVTTPAAAQRELENRVLILAEAARLQAPAPPEDAVRAARQAWEARAGITDLAARLARTGTTEAALEAWFRDTAAIDAYVERRFAGVREADRDRARADWIGLLRNREGLPR